MIEKFDTLEQLLEKYPKKELGMAEDLSNYLSNLSIKVRYMHYGIDTIEMHVDSIDENDVVLIHDDILATGGTAKAAYNLVKLFQPKKIYMNFIIEITEENLHGRDLLEGVELTTLIEV